MDCERADKLLKEFLDSAEAENITVPKLMSFLNDLIDTLYVDGCYPFSSQYYIFKKNYILKNKFFLFEEEAILKEFASSSEFEGLLTLIKQNLPEMTARNKTHTYFCLTFLGVHHKFLDHPVMIKLFEVIHEPPGDLNFGDLAKFGLILTKFVNPLNKGILFAELIRPHIQYLERVGFLTGMTSVEFVRALAYKVIFNFPEHNTDKRFIFQRVLLNLVSDPEVVKHPDCISCLLRSAGIYKRPFALQEEILQGIEKAIIPLMDTLACSELGKLAIDYQEFGLNDRISQTLVAQFRLRLENILLRSENLSMGNILSIMAFYKFSRFHLSHEALAKLVDQMEKEIPKMTPLFASYFVELFPAMLHSPNKRALRDYPTLMKQLNVDSSSKLYTSTFVSLIHNLKIKHDFAQLSANELRHLIEGSMLQHHTFGPIQKKLFLCVENLQHKIKDKNVKRNLLVRLIHVCEQYRPHSVLNLSFNIIQEYGYQIDKCPFTWFYLKLLKIFESKVKDMTLQDSAVCYKSITNLWQRSMARHSLHMIHALRQFSDRLGEQMIQPNDFDDIQFLAQNINLHFGMKNDLMRLPTAAVDMLVTQIMDHDPTLSQRGFVKLTSLIPCGSLSSSKVKQLERFVDVFFEENMDCMEVDKLLLSLDNLCLAGVFPPQTLKTVLSMEFLQNIDQWIRDKSKRVNFTALIDYHILRVNRSVALERPDMGIPWFHDDSNPPFYPMTIKKASTGLVSDDRIRRTRRVLELVLGGRQFLNSNVTTTFKNVIDFECFLNSRGNPVLVNRLTPGHPPPEGFQRIAVDVVPTYSYTFNEQRTLTCLYQQKERHLKKEGYKFVLLHGSDMLGFPLNEDEGIGDYLIEQIFG